MIPTHLRAEHRVDALGIGERRPRLSWRLPSGATRQLAYELDAGERVASDANVLVPWPGSPLAAGERREVRVRVWTDLGESDWSAPLAVEAGLLEAADWSAQWVAPTAEPGRAAQRPAYLVRGVVDVDRPVRRARLYATAHGIYEATIDGVRVSEDELTPGFTEYAVHTHVQTYDVTALLTQGRHEVGALLADGWYRGQVGMTRASDQWGDTTAFLAQLVVEHEDGTRAVHGTGVGWEWTTSQVVVADLIEGQHEDRTRPPGGWAPVAVVERGYDALTISPAPPVQPVEELRPISVSALRPGVHVIDLGQNINGRLRLALHGADAVLTHAEALGPDGDVTTDHLAPDVPFLPEPLTAGQVDRVTGGEVFEPRFTTHGFRYVRIEGPERVAPDDVTGVVVHTALEPRGSFRCSDERVNRLHDAAVWSFRGNACDIPTDCPTRERAGWTGDWQIFAPTASYLYDVAGFSLKWLRDLAATQWEDGTLNNMAPMPPAERTGFLAKLNGSAGWGDAIVLVPWELYGEYGDTAVLAELWPAMGRWLDRAERMAATAHHPDREPNPYVWDTGFHWGEWLEPGSDPGDFPAFIAADKSVVATAYFAWSTRHAAAITSVLGDEEAAARYAALSENVVAAWRAEFLDADGHVVPTTQANLVRALRFGLVPDGLREQAAADLVRLVREAGTHLGTGFLATPDLLPVLADHGHLDVAYGLLLQDTAPSWLAMIDRGATTVWERWEGVDEDGVPHESLNHYSKGAVISFLHRYVAGLERLEPTWRRFRVRPRPGGGITWAEAEHVTPHGPVRVSWREGGPTEVVVPPGCVAEVVLPSGATATVGPGEHSF